MKNLMKKLSVFALAMSVFSLNTVGVKAETTGVLEEDTDVNILFGEDYEIEEPGDGGTNPEIPSKAGFSLWKLPSALKFDKGIMKSGVVKVYSLSEHTNDVHENSFDANYQASAAMVDLTDKDHNWTLNAKLSNFKEKNSDESIQGAKLTWNQNHFEVVKDGKMKHKATDEVTGETEITLEAGSDSKVIMKNNDEKNPKGYFDAAIKDIALTIPAKQGSVNKSYEATITWTLESDFTVEQ